MYFQGPTCRPSVCLSVPLSARPCRLQSWDIMSRVQPVPKIIYGSKDKLKLIPDLIIALLYIFACFVSFA